MSVSAVGGVRQRAHAEEVAMPRALLRSFIFVVCSAAICAAAWAQSIQTVAGGGTDDGRSALAAGLQNPIGVAFDSTGNFYIADYGNNRIRKVSAATGIITTVAG